jgi:ABC-type antimicrobial peptide transport system permease subunit
MARHFWPGAEPIGKRFKYRDSLHEVVGVARNVNTANIAEAAAPIFYLPAQTGNILVRTDPRSPSLMAAARQAAVSLDRNIFVSVTRTEDSLDQLVHPLRSGLMFSGVLGLLALVLAGVGIYGVQAFSVSQRTKEIGIRIALGARPSEVLFLVLRQGAQLVAIGIASGLAVSCAVTSVLSNALFGLNPLDPVAFVGVSLFLALVAMLACYIPVRRATKVDPMVALRYE